jgi:hypothetical protein
MCVCVHSKQYLLKALNDSLFRQACYTAAVYSHAILFKFLLSLKRAPQNCGRRPDSRARIARFFVMFRSSSKVNCKQCLERSPSCFFSRYSQYIFHNHPVFRPYITYEARAFIVGTFFSTPPPLVTLKIIHTGTNQRANLLQCSVFHLT